MKTMWVMIATAMTLWGAAFARDASKTAYEPMQPFAQFAGKSMRGEWRDPDGKEVVDLSTWEFILNGKALQSTHRIVGSDYGGRTIIFFDESAKTYVFHYFTTGGFHTIGEGKIEDGAFVTVEHVKGHADIERVIGRTTFGVDEMSVAAYSVTKAGVESPTITRIYKPLKKTPRLF